MKIPKSTSNREVNIQALTLNKCLAKTRPIEKNKTGDKTEAGQDVLTHCSVVGRVAKEIASTYPATIIKRWFYPEVGLLAAGHDIGKVSPTFQNRIYNALTVPNSEVMAVLKDFNGNIDCHWRHSGVSELAGRYWGLGEYIPSIWGCHHGVRPALTGLTATSQVVGGETWQSVREQLKKALEEEFGKDFPEIHDAVHAKVLSGLTTVADWIGSGELSDLSLEQISNDQIKKVVRRAGFAPPNLKKNLSFEQIFGFSPNEAQVKMAQECIGPGVYVLEAPMGMGKTEAALFVAYKLIASGQATGMYFALPTQSTSDSIYSRVNDYLDKILNENAPIRKALLLYSNASLKLNLMGEDAAPGGSWFSKTKRGILAPFGVGTVDQALMAIMNVRHGFVRTFGLLGKVVILDEVHSYDMYTGTLLDELVRVLKQMSCTVIVLTATLTHERRKELLGSEVKSDAYPLLTSFPQEATAPKEIAIKAPEQNARKVSVAICGREEAVIEEVLSRAKLGEQVLWIENTVKEAQTRYQQILSLTTSEQIDVGLVHSRFTRVDRTTNEKHWVSILGKTGEVDRKEKGRILIGTQVLEQSLDIDADFLVTSICPSDMLLQRMGRLWRHNRKGRPVSSHCQVRILSCDLKKMMSNPAKAFGPSAYVYAPYVLCRTLEVWNSRVLVRLPEDIRSILEQTYTPRQEHGELAKLLDVLETNAKNQRTRALGSMNELAPESDDENAATRYSQIETVEVLLLRQFEQQDEKVLLTLADGSKWELPTSEKVTLATSLLNNCVSVPEYDVIEAQQLSSLKWLKSYMYISNSSRKRVRVALCGKGGSLSNPLNEEEVGFIYDSKMGYRRKNSEEEALKG